MSTSSSFASLSGPDLTQLSSKRSSGGGNGINLGVNPWGDVAVPGGGHYGHDYYRVPAEPRSGRAPGPGHKITRARLIFPVVITVWVASQFLQGMPTAGNDDELEFGLAAGAPWAPWPAWLLASVARGPVPLPGPGL